MGNLYELFLEAGYLAVNNGRVRLSYVGIAANASNLICILPKYLKGSIDADQFLPRARTLIKTLKSYQRTINIDIAGYNLIDYSSNTVNSEISLADVVMNDYLQYGLWDSHITSVVNSPNNEILWDVTIEKSFPIITKQPYYFDLYSSRNEYLNDTIISKIHVWALNYCSSKYGELLDISIDLQDYEIPDLEGLGEKSYLLNVIEKELRITFGDRRILLLKALAELIATSGQYGEDVYTLYGKNKFEHVWENAVSFVFKNEYPMFKKFISSPVWADITQQIILEKRTVKPDVLRWVYDTVSSNLLIIDAKYYLFHFNDVNLTSTNNPGVSDVVKQYFYELILSRKNSGAGWLERETKYLNILIYPGLLNTAKTMEVIGSVSIENVAIAKPIINIYLNPDVLFSLYNEQRPFSDSMINEMILGIAEREQLQPIL